MRVVIDTNVLISTYVYGARLEWLRKCIEKKQVILLFSTSTWTELIHTLSLKKFGWDQDMVHDVLEMILVPNSQLHNTPPRVLPKPCRDPLDDALLTLALGARAEALVTGDKDLLELEGHYPFPILKPADFKNRFFFDFSVSDGIQNLPVKKIRPKKKPA
jgi:putative PIN family toxin of toxin-antitoxin system